MTLPLPPGAKKNNLNDVFDTDDPKEIAEIGSPAALRELLMIGLGQGEHDETPRNVRVTALKEVLDRALGKSSQHVDVNVTTNEVLQKIQQSYDALVYEDLTVIDAESNASPGEAESNASPGEADAQAELDRLLNGQ